MSSFSKRNISGLNPGHIIPTRRNSKTLSICHNVAEASKMFGPYMNIHVKRSGPNLTEGAYESNLPVVYSSVDSSPSFSVDIRQFQMTGAPTTRFTSEILEGISTSTPTFTVTDGNGNVIVDPTYIGDVPNVVTSSYAGDRVVITIDFNNVLFNEFRVSMRVLYYGTNPNDDFSVVCPKLTRFIAAVEPEEVNETFTVEDFNRCLKCNFDEQRFNELVSPLSHDEKMLLKFASHMIYNRLRLSYKHHCAITNFANLLELDKDNGLKSYTLKLDKGEQIICYGE